MYLFQSSCGIARDDLFLLNSILAVGAVLQALKSGGHVPYRDSKVTRLLQVRTKPRDSRVMA